MIYPLAILDLLPVGDPEDPHVHATPGRTSDKNTILLHITAGPTSASAIATFKASEPPHRVSAHVVIDRDGTVTQLVDFANIAWHASQCNTHAIGIEHAGSKALPCTETQYAASAALVAWLCGQFGLACDRAHIRTHNEASPRDGHVGCCTDGLDPDRVVQMAAALLSAQLSS